MVSLGKVLFQWPCITATSNETCGLKFNFIIYISLCKDDNRVIGTFTSIKLYSFNKCNTAVSRVLGQKVTTNSGLSQLPDWIVLLMRRSIFWSSSHLCGSLLCNFLLTALYFHGFMASTFQLNLLSDTLTWTLFSIWLRQVRFSSVTLSNAIDFSNKLN